VGQTGSYLQWCLYRAKASSFFTSSSGYIGKGSYGGMLKICAHKVGLYLTAMFLFGFSHKRLLMPGTESSMLNEE